MDDPVLSAFVRAYEPCFDHVCSYNTFLDAVVDIVNGTHLETSAHRASLSRAGFSVPTLDQFGIRKTATPKECRARKLSYHMNLWADADIDGTVHEKVCLGKVPVMVGSAYCSSRWSETSGECDSDPGGYFIVNGSEKSIIAQERMMSNFMYTIQSGSTKVVEYRAQKTKELKVHVFKVYQRHGRMYGETQHYKDIPLVAYAVHALQVDPSTAVETIGGDFSLDWDVHTIEANHVLPNMTASEKFVTLACMVRMLQAFEHGIIGETDRDHYKNKRVDYSGDLLLGLFKQIWPRFLRDALGVLQRTEVNVITPLSLFRASTITNGLKYSLSTGSWGVSAKFRTGVSQVLNRMNYGSVVSQLRKINSPVGKEGKVIKPRMLHPSSYGRVCPSETPEGANCGLLKALSVSALLSSETDPYVVDLFARKHANVPVRVSETVVFVNGIPKASTPEPWDLVRTLRDRRRSCDLPFDVSVYYDERLEVVHVQTDKGRIVRPLWVVGRSRPTRPCTWDELVFEGKIEYLDASEERNAFVALTWGAVGSQHTHVEIHPALLFGTGVMEIPFSDHNQAPRNCYQAAQKKQAIGLPYANGEHRMDTATHVLWYPQKPLATTQLQDALSDPLSWAGQNAVVAIMCYTGFNMEDSVLVNQGAIDRGLFRSTVYKTTTEELGSDDAFVRPNDTVPGRKLADYETVGLDGMPEVGAYLTKDSVLIGKIHTKPRTHDASVVSKFDGARVDKVALAKGEHRPFASVRVREVRIPEIGDKVCSRAGQKGTIGMVVAQEDMPFSLHTGLVPDVIINPNAMPSRMTIGQVLECLVSKSSALNGVFYDATPFLKDGGRIHEDAAHILRKHGFDVWGTERMVNGMTGEVLEASVFMGPTYYSRLKHMVADKVHARARGCVQGLTRQPVDNRSRGSGLRLGTMESDCLIAHGISATIQERLLHSSDAFQTRVCAQCGMLTEAVCRVCRTNEHVVDIELPYALKLLFQELLAMGVVSMIRPDTKTLELDRFRSLSLT